MTNYNKLKEFIADIVHQQWMAWSIEIGEELKLMKIDSYREDNPILRSRINTRIQLWQKCWKPYKKLSEEEKDKDREWADKFIDNLPIRCPVYQCGGLMVTKERPVAKMKGGHDPTDGIVGDYQTPDLICSNCGAIYQFKRFKYK
jgi:hypothetical protein